MKLLSIDSSGLVATAALWWDDTLRAEYTVNYKKTHSQTLLPMIDEIVRMTETDLHDLDAIAVASGPGSFTGLRIGSATAKGLGLALGLPLIPVPTLEGIACNFYGMDDAVICPMMDARRTQVYTGVYDVSGEELRILVPQEACPVEDILQKCNALGKKVLFAGDGVPVYRELIVQNMTVPFAFAPAHLSRQRAGAVAFRAQQLFAQGVSETAAEHAPVYLRKSQAERELESRGGHLRDE